MRFILPILFFLVSMTGCRSEPDGLTPALSAVEPSAVQFQGESDFI